MTANTNLRVLLDGSPLCDGRGTAGIGRYIKGIVPALQQVEGIEIEIVDTGPPRKDEWLSRFLSAQPGIAAAAIRSRPTLVHGLASDPVLGWPLHRQVVTVHDVIPWTKSPAEVGRRTALYLRAQRRRLRRVAAVIAVSPGVASDVRDRLGVRSDRIHIVPHGVSPVFCPESSADDERERAAVGVQKKPYLLWVGSLRSHDPRKALDTVVEAVAHLDRELTLVLAGAGGDESRRLAGAARERGVRLHLTDYVSDECLAALYRGAAAALLPSLDEGFGLPALEAMACGAPVVTTRGTNTAELTVGASVLADPGDPMSLSNAIVSVLDDPQLAARLRTAALARTSEPGWNRAARLTAAVYRVVVSPTRSGAPAY